jgi:thiamine kinase-like enzyme
VDLLNAKVDAAEPAIRVERPGLMPLLDVLRRRINARATDLRTEAPCLVHTDANFHNLILGDDQVTLIDWDYPAVRYPACDSRLTTSAHPDRKRVVGRSV